MASPTSTFATLRALHLVIADALDDIQRVFLQNSFPDSFSPISQCSSPVYPGSPGPSPATSPLPATPPASFPPTPLSATFPSSSHTDAGAPIVDYPSPDLPFDANSPSEQLALHPDAAAAASRIVAACGQMSNIVHKPFSSLCDATMSYNIPACMRLVEHLHVAEILREAEENRQRCLASGHGAAVPLAGTKNIEGLHIADITSVICSYAGNNYVDPSNLVHVLRLLSTHHIFRETAPDIFALTRVASFLDSGKSVKVVFSNPETKYDDTDGTAAFVASVTDELFKSAAYLTEAFTGVQLPAPKSAPDRSFAADRILSATTRIPSTSSFVINDAVPCAPTTRSSSVLTHIVYPEDEDVQPPSRLLPSTESLEKVGTGVPAPSQPPATELTAHLPPRLSPVEPSTQVEKDCLRSGYTTTKLAAFNLAFGTNIPFFDWLENGGEDPLGGTGQGACVRTPTRVGSMKCRDMQLAVPVNSSSCTSRKSFRLQRFSKSMMATSWWEAPKAILSGFDWYSLPKGSTIVDVGGGIGSTTMILACALNDSRVDSVKKQDGAHNDGLSPASNSAPRHRSKLPSDPSLMASDEPRGNTIAKNDVNFRFVVQDKSVVTALGIDAWRSRCPEMLESGQVVFQDQDFFEPQPSLEPPHLNKHPAVYLLRVVLHDWPDEAARRILINLRVASDPGTRLVIAEHVLPLACVDEDVPDYANIESPEENGTEEWTLDSVLANIEGAERTLVPPPLLPNLGKANANAYWMDLIMHATLNGKERTLRECCALALSAGWRVARMTRPEGSLFAYLVCEPITLPDEAQVIYNAIVLSSELSTVVALPPSEHMHHSHLDPSRHKLLPPRPVSLLLPSPILERSSSRCGTPTFGSRMLLPKDEDLSSPKIRGAGAAKKWLKSKGLGVRSVVMQKTEKQREEQHSAKGASTRDGNDAESGAPSSSSHTRVWWKKSPPNSDSNSRIMVHELIGEVPEHRRTGRRRRDALKSSDVPSTPSPRVSPVHQNWPSTESTALSMAEVSPSVPRARRPSVASITRKLSFATFARRPSIADITEHLPTPPPSATLMDLVPPPTLQSDTERRLKHLPSLPTLGRSEIATGTTSSQPAMPRRPSVSSAGQSPPLQPVLKPALPRRPDMAESHKSGILKSRPHTSKQSSPDTGGSESSTAVPRRQRRVTLASAPGAPRTHGQAQGPGGVPLPPNSVPPMGPEVKRVPSVPRLPRRLSIPMLRHRKSPSVVQDGVNGR